MYTVSFIELFRLFVLLEMIIYDLFLSLIQISCYRFINFFFVFCFLCLETKNSVSNLNYYYYYIEYKFLYVKINNYSLCYKNTVNLYINLSKIYIRDKSIIIIWKTSLKVKNWNYYIFFRIFKKNKSFIFSHSLYFFL